MATPFDLYEPFDSGPGSNILEDSWRKMARHWLQSGVLRGEDNDLQVYADSSGIQCKVKTGKAAIRGHHGENTSEKILPLTAFAGIGAGKSRLDIVVARGDFLNNVIELDVVTGVAATTGTQVAPAVTQSATTWELKLAELGPFTTADVTVDAGDVADWRLWAVPTHGAGGEIATSVDVTANQAGIVAEADLTNMTVVAVLQPGRLYRVSNRAGLISSNTSDRLALYTKEGATYLDTALSPAPNTSSGQTMRGEAKVTKVAVGRYTFKAAAERLAGSGSTTMAATATFKSRIYVEDLGPAA